MRSTAKAHLKVKQSNIYGTQYLRQSKNSIHVICCYCSFTELQENNVLMLLKDILKKGKERNYFAAANKCIWFPVLFWVS